MQRIRIRRLIFREPDIGIIKEAQDKITVEVHLSVYARGSLYNEGVLDKLEDGKEYNLERQPSGTLLLKL